ncbi:TetR/AcrR family transcriptional regulator [Eggerthellaceae bacterium zg-1084]|uniref:TetR/AcrR family transcriptional regulator n=1 Tax=Berryella wangjianweii TaxID=2734634 RepID=A0A6M8J9L9_9ACTN|nr:TetR/AcrR family transcriptional regulator [Berryella wangjianweii]NPD31043.1 TetR/AcrR family transcriptional regulator [Berryella wangjianweii]NPD31905.1 TetR/AcrR family transcriptional regulator [Eggerthellaceae bacterium zg-997]QKF07502.1 TetR/AcrR family transcriptional regulator [Berryella wangjianweii]
MTRRPGANSAETKANLLASATEEFAANGYSKASLRRICEKAGVTTGALYFFFENKNDLFVKVIDPIVLSVIEAIEEDYNDRPENLTNVPIPEPGTETAISRKLFDICYDNRKVTDIILSNQDHPAVKALYDRISQIFSRRFEALSRALYTEIPAGSMLNANTFSWFTQTETFVGRYVLLLNLPKDEAIAQLDAIIRVLRAGIGTLIETDEKNGLLPSKKAECAYRALHYTKQFS